MNERPERAAATATAEGSSSSPSKEWPAGMSELVQQAVRQVLPSAVEEKIRELMPSVIEDFAEEYGLAGEVAGLLHLLASKSGDNYEDLLRKALTLYNVALDARDNGNRLAILNPDDVIVREIAGIEPSEHPPQPVGR